jgi:hypothetical protein
MARNILKSPNSFVAMTDSDTAFHETETNLNLYNTVQSCNYSASFPRQNLKQVGSQEFVSRDFFNQPDVQLSLSYVPEPSVNNEMYGLFCDAGATGNFVNFLSGRLEASTNFYVFNSPNQHDDAFDDITSKRTDIDFSGYEIISFGNCFPTTYGLTYGVGNLPIVSASYICSNMEYILPTGASGDSPAINLTGGNKDNAALQVFNFQNGTIKPRIANPTDPNSSITLQNLQVGGQNLSGVHFVQTVDMSVDLPRVSNYGLGNDFAYGRKAQLPANGRFSVSSLVSGLDSGVLTGVLASDSGYDFELVLASTGINSPKDAKMIYQIEDAKLVSYNYSMPVNNQMTFDAEFSFEVTETKGLKISGSYYSDWNPIADDYIAAVEEFRDGYEFSADQKEALSKFSDELVRNDLQTKIKRMWLVGFTRDAALRNVMTSTTQDSWIQMPDDYVSGGFAPFNDNVDVIVGVSFLGAVNMTGLGITGDDCGAFFAGTSMDNGSAAIINSYTASNQMFQLKQDGTSPWPVVFRSAANPNVESDPQRKDGVFIGYRTNQTHSSITRIYGGKNAQTSTVARGYDAAPTDPIYIWGSDTKGDVSTAGITSGLTTDQAETLGGLLYDLCVGIGHTDLEDTTA